MVVKDSLVAGQSIGIPGNDVVYLPQHFPARYLLSLGTDDDETAVFGIAEARNRLGETDAASQCRKVILLCLGIQPVPLRLADENLRVSTADQVRDALSAYCGAAKEVAEAEDQIADPYHFLGVLPAQGSNEPNSKGQMIMARVGPIFLD